MKPKGAARILALVGMLGIAYLGSTILVLSFLPTGYSPISQVASDYGVGRFAFEMNLAFLFAGIGFISLALAVGMAKTARAFRVGSSFLFIAGSTLVINAFFATDIERSPVTLHGTIHGLAGVVFFITAPIGILLISYGFGRGRFLITLLSTLIAVIFLAANTALSLDANGLAERIAILVIFSSSILVSYRIARLSSAESSYDHS